MCIVFVAHSHDPSSKYRLVVASNRDEVFFRPSRGAHFWDEHSHVLAGKDLTAGAHQGTWLGITTEGKFAVLTNFSDRTADAQASHTEKPSPTPMVAHWYNPLFRYSTSAIAVMCAVIAFALCMLKDHSSIVTLLISGVVFLATHVLVSRYPSTPLGHHLHGKDSTTKAPQIISRGGLARNFLCAEKGTLSASEYMESVRQNANCYDGFNLICGDRDNLLYFTNRHKDLKIISLSDSIHGVSNSHIGEFPKVRRGVKHFRKLLSDEKIFCTHHLRNDLKNDSSADPGNNHASEVHQESTASKSLEKNDTEVPHFHIENEEELIESLMDLLSNKSGGTNSDEKLVLKEVICVPHHVIRKACKEEKTPDIWYGTRTHTVILMKHSGEITFVERDFDIKKDEWETRVFRIDPNSED